MTFRKLMMPAALMGALLPITPAMAAGDPVRGKTIFARCSACHSMEPAKKAIGPSLAGVFGRKAGTLGGYAFSPAMKKYGQVWDVKTMEAFLTAPTKTVPGTKMVFMGLSKADDRADLIAYMQGAK